MQSIVLNTPIKVDSVFGKSTEISIVRMRRPTLKDLTKVNLSASTLEQIIVLIELTTGLKKKNLLDMDAADFMKISEILNGSLQWSSTDDQKSTSIGS